MSLALPSLPWRRAGSLRIRARLAGWMGLLSMVFLLGLGGFGGLSMPQGGWDRAELGSLVICSGTGFRVIDGAEGEPLGHDPGLCLMCLPLTLEGAGVAALISLILVAWGAPVERRIQLGRPLAVRPRCRAFLTVRAPRAPPLG